MLGRVLTFRSKKDSTSPRLPRTSLLSPARGERFLSCYIPKLNTLMSLLCVQIRHLKRPPQGMNARPIRNSPPYVGPIFLMPCFNYYLEFSNGPVDMVSSLL